MEYGGVPSVKLNTVGPHCVTVVESTVNWNAEECGMKAAKTDATTAAGHAAARWWDIVKLRVRSLVF
jgi:hypothetical protein